LEGALGAEDEAVTVVGPAVGHVVAFRAADFVAGEICWGKELDFGDDDGLVAGGDGIGGRVFEFVGGYEERVCGWMENASFVEVGSAGVID